MAPMAAEADQAALVFLAQTSASPLQQPHFRQLFVVSAYVACVQLLGH